MLNRKHKQYAERIIDLIQEGEGVARLAHTGSHLSGSPTIQDKDKITLHAWLAKVSNIIELVFGQNSPQYRGFQAILPAEGLRYIGYQYEIYPIIGFLKGALDDLEKGFLISQEFIVAGEVFDSILDQADALLKAGFKDPAAVLARVVLEDSLRRLARSLDLDENKKAAQINEDLKKENVYHQPQWRLIQAWLDIGNSAAHGRFSEFTETDVANQITGIRQYLASHLIAS